MKERNKSEVDDCCKKKDVNKNTKEKKTCGEHKKEEKEQKEDWMRDSRQQGQTVEES